MEEHVSYIQIQNLIFENQWLEENSQEKIKKAIITKQNSLLFYMHVKKIGCNHTVTILTFLTSTENAPASESFGW